MKIEKIYRLNCQSENNIYKFHQTKYFTSKDEALSYIPTFKENILKK